MRRLATAAVALVAVMGAASAGSADTALPERDFPEHQHLRLAEMSTFVSPEDLLGMTLEIADASAAATIELSLHPRVTSRIQFGQTLAGDSLGAVEQNIGPLPVGELPRDAEGRLRLALPIVAETAEDVANAIHLPGPGVYPLVVTLSGPDGEPLEELVTHVVRLPASDGDAIGIPLQVSLVIPFRGPPMTTDEDQWPAPLTGQQTDRLGRTAGALSAAPDVPVTVVALPQTIDQLAGGDQAAVSVLDQLVADVPVGSRQVVAAPWTMIDLGTWSANGLAAGQLDAGLDSLTAHFGEAVSGRTVIADDTLTPEALAELVDRGAEQVVMGEELLDHTDLGDLQVTMTERFLVTDATGRRVPAVQTDQRLEELLTSSDQPALVANRVLADLSVLARDLPDLQRQAVIRAPSDGGVHEATEIITTELADPTGTGSPAEPLLVARTLDDLANGPAPTELERQWSHEEPRPLGAYIADLDATTAAVGSLAATLDDPAAPPLAAAGQLMAASADRRLADGGAGLLDAAQALVAETLAPIHIPEQGDITLTDTEGVIPVAIENDMDRPVTVRVHIRADRLELPGGEAVEAVLEPGHNRLELEVRARASGVFPVEVLVTTPDDSTNLAAGRFTVRSTAVSGIGLVLSLCAGLFLALWWLRNFRSTRRSRHLVPSSSHPTNRARAGQSGTIDP